MDWKVAFPLHPEYRTLPMVWYIPPLSPIQSAAENGGIDVDEDRMPDVRSLRIPLQYLANLLTAGDETPVALALERMLAMRMFMRRKHVDGVLDQSVLDRVGLSQYQVEEMYRYMAIADYEDRFVIPTSHKELGDAGLRPARHLRVLLRRGLQRRQQHVQPVRAGHAQDARRARVVKRQTERASC